jgi:hypothetical protein
VQAIEPERHFSFTWHPYAIDPGVDYSQEPPTVVEFRLEEIGLEQGGVGTLVRVTESGFDRIPAGRRAEAFRMNDNGWGRQLENVRIYVGG